MAASQLRALHLKELGERFVQGVKLARGMGPVKLGTIAVDGTKIKANEGRHKAMSYGLLLKADAEFKRQIEALPKRAGGGFDAAYNPRLAVDEAREAYRKRKWIADVTGCPSGPVSHRLSSRVYIDRIKHVDQWICPLRSRRPVFRNFHIHALTE